MATNFEFYKDKILNEFIKEYQMHCFARAMEIVTGVEFHIGCECGKCSSCEKIVFNWLYTEHIEQPKLTKRERAFCEAVQTGWIARDKNGDLTWFGINPDGYEKRSEIWGFGMARSVFSKIHEAWCEFAFIKWEDEQPWAVEDLLKLEAMEEVHHETY